MLSCYLIVTKHKSIIFFDQLLIDNEQVWAYVCAYKTEYMCVAWKLSHIKELILNKQGIDLLDLLGSMELSWFARSFAQPFRKLIHLFQL